MLYNAYYKFIGKCKSNGSKKKLLNVQHLIFFWSKKRWSFSPFPYVRNTIHASQIHFHQNAIPVWWYLELEGTTLTDSNSNKQSSPFILAIGTLLKNHSQHDLKRNSADQEDTRRRTNLQSPSFSFIAHQYITTCLGSLAPSTSGLFFLFQYSNT